MLQNSADDDGGAIYMNKKNMYLEDCSVTSNAAIGDGGGIYVSRSGSIIVSGTTAIRNNDGNDTLDNLVLGRNALIYDYGLMPGSEIHLRSTSNASEHLRISALSSICFSLSSARTARLSALRKTFRASVRSVISFSHSCL